MVLFLITTYCHILTARVDPIMHVVLSPYVSDRPVSALSPQYVTVPCPAAVAAESVSGAWGDGLPAGDGPPAGAAAVRGHAHRMC